MTIDYTKFEGADLLHELNDDATKWAAAFCQLNPDVKVDEHVLMGWFANAIEHSTDFRTGRVHNGDHAQYLRDRVGPEPMSSGSVSDT